MRHRHVAGVATAALLTSIALAGGTAGAQEEPGEFAPLTVDPTSGPPGTVVSVSGEDCAIPHPFDAIGFAWIFRADDEFTLDDVLATGEVEASPDGDWTTTIAVPEGFDPEALYVVTAVCLVVDQATGAELIIFDYEPVEFDLTGAPPTEPPVVTPPALPPVLEVAPAVAPVATAVRARPTFTG